jgi:hypothetical protein
MRVDLDKFTQLYDHLCEIDLVGTVAGIRPSLASLAKVRSAISKGAPFLPGIYREQYYKPLDGALPHVMEKLAHEVKSGQKSQDEMATELEWLAAGIYQHAPKATGVDASSELKRLSAVVSDLFRSFLDRDKRSAAGINLVATTPPLALFQSEGQRGPFTIESDVMKQKVGMSIGVVMLPAPVRNHPVLWAALSHEVCGHDVVHADDGLLPEMAAAVSALFAPDFESRKHPDSKTLNALIWSYWMDEAAADVYGVLNMGPAFALNLAAFLAAFRARLAVDFQGKARPTRPALATEASPHEDHTLDDHPVDLLRLHLAAGAIEAMSALDAAKRSDYLHSVEAVAEAVADGAREVSLTGIVPGPAGPIPVEAKIPLAEAAAAARRVGKMIATHKFKKLNGHSIQEIETWDDADEAASEAIARQILNKQSIAGHGDAAQLLAGATLALLQSPAHYKETQALLNEALDHSSRADPIWGALTPAHAFAPHVFRRPQAKMKAAAARTTKPGEKKSAKKSKRGRGKR